MKPFIVVCLGDSITCEWDGPKYPAFWQELLNKKIGPGKIKVISAGVNGETAQDGYYRLDSEVFPHRPNLVTIMFGHNEVYHGVKPYIYQQYLAKIINRLQHHSPDINIWLLSPNIIDEPQLARRYQPYLAVLIETAAQKKVKYIDIWGLFKLVDCPKIFTNFFPFTAPLQKDFAHPNDFGHRLIAQELMRQADKMTLKASIYTTYHSII